MNIPKQKIRIQIEITCGECDGAGSGTYDEEEYSNAREWTCSDCDGTGWQTERITLDELKEILDSGE